MTAKLGPIALRSTRMACLDSELGVVVRAVSERQPNPLHACCVEVTADAARRSAKRSRRHN
jgi:hypothetical protein